MKTLYESLLTGKVNKPSAKVVPNSRDELQQLIDEYIKEIKPHPGQEVDLNWIDISLVDDLSGLFMYTEYVPVIDKWDIDHVKDFSFMFADNEYITRSPLPRLQKKLLIRGCYCRMFYRCEALQTPPELPTTKLTDNCYEGMFEDCSSLKATPELPSKNLTHGCYTAMFDGCASLVEPPKLPAKRLATNCYSYMFSDCTSLEHAPELPATKLMYGCYSDMFSGCSSLKKKAELPHGVVPDYYTVSDMYKDCPCENK